jgi:hypothetical protein
VGGSYEHGDEPLDCIKREGYLELLSDHQLLHGVASLFSDVREVLTCGPWERLARCSIVGIGGLAGRGKLPAAVGGGRAGPVALPNHLVCPDVAAFFAGTGRTAEEFGFDSRQGARDLSPLHIVQTGSGAHPT